jgi:hypothetical protein
VVDLDPHGPHYPGSASLAEMVADGPRQADLVPGRRGVAVLRNGGIGPSASAEVVAALLSGWERVILRLPPRPVPGPMSVAVVPVRLLIPAGLFSLGSGAAVFQSTPTLMRLPSPGVRLPVPSQATVAAFLAGRLPVAGDRWVRAWSRVWEFPWDR